MLPWRVHELGEIGPFGQVPQGSGGGGVSSGEDRRPSIAIFFVRKIDGEGGRFLKSSPAGLRGQRRGRFLRPAGARGAGTARSDPSSAGLARSRLHLETFGPEAPASRTTELPQRPGGIGAAGQFGRLPRGSGVAGG